MANFRADAENIFAHILETWGMMLVDKCSPEKAAFAEDQTVYVGSLNFYGVINGTYSVICQDPFAQCLTRNLLSSDDEISQEEIQDSVKELVNILSGNCLTIFFGEDAVFTLSSPYVEIKSWQEAKPLLQESMVCLTGDDYPVTFVFKSHST